MMPEVLLKTDSGMDAAAASGELAEYATQRANLYLLLATLFLEAPGAEALEKLRSNEMTTVMDEVSLTLGADLNDIPTGELEELLAEEFTRLFLFSPGGRLAPYESLQRPKASGLLMGPESQKVAAYIEAAGLAYRSQFKEMPDHIGVQLEFLAYLSQEESNAWSAKRPSDAVNAIRFQQDFFSRFIGTWVFDFLKKVVGNSEMEFYRGLAEFAADFLRQEQVDIKDRLIAGTGTVGYCAG